MNLPTVLLILAMLMNPVTLFDFESDTDVSEWRVEDDVVMGGRSSGHFALSPDGYGHFYGSVSLENNGGFSSVEYKMPPVSVSPAREVVLRVKGDGKRYQFRFKENRSDYYSFIHFFETTGEWQVIRMPLAAFEARYRGRMLDRPPFEGDQMTSIRFLIGNKKPQDFSLLIDYIRIE